MKQRRWMKVTACAMVFAWLLGLLPGTLADTPVTSSAIAAAVPAKAAMKTGVDVHKNAKAIVDASNLSEGYIMITYLGSVSKIKVQITNTTKGGATYTYDLNSSGRAETFPLTDGNGTYTINIFENISGTSYAQAYSCQLTMTLRDAFLPYLYSNQYVNYSSGSAVVAKGAEITAGKTTDLEKLQAVFTYVVSNFSYDYNLAATVQSGYLPNVDSVLAKQTGICFDYAAVMTAMLRSQNIPTKLVVGYAGTVYHAWISVYLQNVGWVDSAIYFDGTNWTMMDPTYVSTGAGSAEVMSYVTNPANYSQKYAY